VTLSNSADFAGANPSIGDRVEEWLLASSEWFVVSRGGRALFALAFDIFWSMLRSLCRPETPTKNELYQRV
jgi:hypothetical protein